MFKRLTEPQRRTLAALRQLGEMTVQPDDARPLRALQRRGYVRYKRGRDGERIAMLKLNARELRAVKRRMYNVPREHWHTMWAGWNAARIWRDG